MNTCRRGGSWLVIMAVSVLAACRPAGSEQKPPRSGGIALDTEVIMTPAMTIAVTDGPEIQLVSVQDSRCPSDVTCVWDGEARVQLSIRRASGAPALHEVSQASAANVGGYLIQIVEVTPYPNSTSKIDPADYRVTLKVGKV